MGGTGWSGASGRGGMSYGERPGEGADNLGGYPREGGFASERGFGHVPGQRWGGGYGGYGGYGGHGERGREGPPDGRGFSGSDFGPARDPHMGYGYRGTDMGMGAPDEDRGPHYGKGPKGYKRSDTRIYDDVCEAIADQGHIDASDVEVKVVDGIVTLSGTVKHRQDKKGLELLVERTRGVEEVYNELRLERHVTHARPASTTGDGNHKNGKSVRS